MVSQVQIARSSRPSGGFLFPRLRPLPRASATAAPIVPGPILREGIPEQGDQTVNLILGILIATAALLAGIDYLFHRTFVRRRLSEAEQRARAVLEDAERQAEIRLKELELEAREKADAAEAAFDQDMRRRRTELQTARRQVEDQERLLERKAALLAQKQTEVEGAGPGPRPEGGRPPDPAAGAPVGHRGAARAPGADGGADGPAGQARADARDGGPGAAPRRPRS